MVRSTIAAKLREFLREAAGEGGTGEEAQLVNYTLLGKTGTAVRFEDGRYVRGEYTASFAASFPADDPQLVVIVKIDNPKGKLLRRPHGGAGHPDDAAAGAGSRRVAIDRSRLADAIPLPCRSPDLATAASDGTAGGVLALPALRESIAQRGCRTRASRVVRSRGRPGAPSAGFPGDPARPRPSQYAPCLRRATRQRPAPVTCGLSMGETDADLAACSTSSGAPIC